MNKAFYTEMIQRKFPLSTEGLDFIQTQILLAAEYAKAAGGNYILSGCTVTGSNVSDGTVIIDGELLPFKGGIKQNTVRIRETMESISAENEIYINAYLKKYVEFGNNVDGENNFNWSDFKEFPTNKYLIENTVPSVRTVNGLPLTDDISLSTEDIAKVTPASGTAGGIHFLAIDSDGKGFLCPFVKIVNTDWTRFISDEIIGEEIPMWRIYYGNMDFKGSIHIPNGYGTLENEYITFVDFETGFDISDKTIEKMTTDVASSMEVRLIIEIVNNRVKIKVSYDDYQSLPSAIFSINFSINIS